ncbi:MAG: peptidylprolyl isomerase, partial [Muribaculaceae bacterium]|nr:peptidylprolyl isomerase [Muribaculaceae bacterium]
MDAKKKNSSASAMNTVAAEANIVSNEGTVVLVSTSLGDIKVLLYDDTPIHRDNFIKLAKEGFYDSLLFHRVIKDFM